MITINYNVSKAQLDKVMGVPIYIDVILYDESVQNGKSPVEKNWKKLSKINGKGQC